MTKRLNSKYKVCKKKRGIHKNVWGVEKATRFRSIRILKRNSFSAKQKLNKLSSFNKRLQIKQGLKHFYCNISEKAFQQLLIKSISSQSKTLNKLISLLESRIDIILYRACFVNSLHMARQLINHGFISINSKPICSIQTILYQGDILEVQDKNILLKQKIINVLKQRQFKQYYSIINLGKQRYSQNQKNKEFLSSLIKSLNCKNRNFTLMLKKICLQYNDFLYIKKLKRLESIPIYLEVNFRLLKVIFLWDPKFTEVYYPIKLKYKKHNKSCLFSYNEIIYND